MSATPRELVRQCLRFASPERVPRDLWVLRWAELHYPREVAEILRRFPPDLAETPEDLYPPSPRMRGKKFHLGTFVDEWGCVFETIQDGVLGEVREPQLPELAEWAKVQPPYEMLLTDRQATRDRINRFCGQTDLFVVAEPWQRPWERYQFIRGSMNALMDFARPDEDVLGLLGRIHEYYMRELELWLDTEVDAVHFMDDWGSQRSLLISPVVWREVFKPLYRDYCDAAHAAGKFILMHSDGHILEILPDLVEIGVDAVNSQLFCMDMAEVARRGKGKITFWGEIDRQHVLPSPDPEAARQAVRRVARHLYDPAGGVIGMCEFSAGAHPPTVAAVFEEWERVPASFPASAR